MINKRQFIDLHLHTTYSELDGACKIEELVQFAKENNLGVVSSTDHGNMNNAINLYIECKKEDIKPIIGSEVYCSLGLVDKEIPKGDGVNDLAKKNFHLILLAKNITGYKNLVKLTTYANIENFYRKPRVTLEKLKEHSEGLICTTACVGSEFAHYINSGELNKAEQRLKEYQNTFGDDFYIEYGYHEFESEETYVRGLENLATKLNIKTIIANDTHYLKKEDELAHKILMCKGEKQTVNDESKFDYTHNYYKNREEIIETFSKFPQINVDKCIDNIYEIIDKVENYEIKFGEYVYPEFPTPNGESQEEYLVELIKSGAKNRYGNNISKEVVERIKYEFGVIRKMNFCGYFNMVADYTNWAKNNGVIMSSGRGSISGSLLAYVIGITEVDSLKYNLLFERFLNPERVSFPDADSDFSDRGLMLNYLKEKYGTYGAVPISTKGYLKGKSAIKTVASRLGLNYTKFNSALSSIKDIKLDSVDKILEADKSIKKQYEEDSEWKQVIDLARKIEGNIQSTGVHASGVIVCHKDISDYIPIVKTKDGLCGAYSDKITEKIGLIKYDILGLGNLNIINNCISRINVDIDIKNLELDDKKTYELLQQGETNGVFQLESSGMKSLLKRLHPENINHIDAVLALFRPGAMQFIDDYVANKNDPSKIKYFDERAKECLELTYGQMIYQEQVMLLARILAGYTLAESDLLRRAIGKKDLREMMEHEERFISGCISGGMTKEKSVTLYKQIVEFANYSFNRSHSVAYAMTSYQTAYLKANYFHEFMCSLLDNSADDSDKKERYLSECVEKGVRVLAPKINLSTNRFEITSERDIVFPFLAIKGLGQKISERIIVNRNKKGDFTSFLDFCIRIKPDKKTLVALLESNCFSEFGSSKKYLYLIDHICTSISDIKKNPSLKLMDVVKSYIHKELIKEDKAVKELIKQRRAISGASKQAKEDREQINAKIAQRETELLADVEQELLKNNHDFTKREISEFELQYLSYQITSNVNSIFQKYKDKFDFVPIEAIDNKHVGERINVVGEVKDIREIITKGGKKMAFATLAYCGATIGLTFFNSQWVKDGFSRLVSGDYVYIDGEVQLNRDESFGKYNMVVNKLNIMKCLVGEETYTQDVTGWSDECKDILRKGLTSLSNLTYNSNMDLSKILIIKSDDSEMVLKGKFWISDFGQYRDLLRRYKLGC